MSPLQDHGLTAAESRVAARAHKVAARARLDALRADLRTSLVAKKARMADFAEECKRERLAVRGAIFAMRESALEGLSAQVKAARQTAKERRAARLLEARSASLSAIAAARVALAADRQHHSEQDRITTHEHRRKAEIEKVHKQTLAGGALHGPKLEKLRPLLERARTITPAAGESKVEALWRYAKAHPEEMHAILEPKAHEAIEKKKAEIAEVEKSVRAPNAFELKRAARIERMRGRAEKLRAEAEGAFAREHAIGDRIPMGQPILVGHHSEKKHRRDLKKMDALARKGVALSKEAKEMARRAASAEKNRAISSDDPDAIPKLRAQLAEMEKNRARMRAANVAIRAGGDAVAALRAQGFSEKVARALTERDAFGNVGFPPYKLQNDGAEHARIKKRIAELEARASSPARPPETIGNATLSEADNRVRIAFPGIPPEATRTALKGAGFRWSPSVGSWQRHASLGAWSEARRIAAKHASSPAPAPAPTNAPAPAL